MFLFLWEVVGFGGGDLVLIERVSTCYWRVVLKGDRKIERDKGSTAESTE